MIDELDNAAQQWLTQLTTTDGATLSGFGSILRGAPVQLRRRRCAGSRARSRSPRRPTRAATRSPPAYAISDSGSHLFDLLGLLGAYATIYALTDHANTGVGGSQPALAYFDGDPFPADNQVADGEATLHDRALGVLRVLLVNIDRLHRDPTSGLLVDDVTFSGATPTRGARPSARPRSPTPSSRCAPCGGRSPRSSSSTATPRRTRRAGRDSRRCSTTPACPLTGAPGGAGTPVSDRLDALIDAEAQLLLNSLTTADGHALRRLGREHQARRPAPTTRSTPTPPPSAGSSPRTSRPETSATATAPRRSSPGWTASSTTRPASSTPRRRRRRLGLLHADALRHARGRAARHVRARRRPAPATPRSAALLQDAHRPAHQAGAQRLGRPQRRRARRLPARSASTWATLPGFGGGLRLSAAAGCRWPSAR